MAGTELWPDNQIGAELAYAADFYKALRPAVFLFYERNSYHSVEDGDFRVTLLTDTIAPGDFLLCVGVSLLLGLLLCAVAVWHSRFSRSLMVTLAILPAVVCVVILMVNGNVGTGAFNLVRFRSAPGSAREIAALFVAMGTGLITGMGYLGYGVLFTVILGAAMMVYNAVSLRSGAVSATERTLHVTIPEDLDYEGTILQ